MSILPADTTPIPLKQPAAVKPIDPAADYREFGDANSARNEIYGRVLATAQTLPPLVNQRHTLRITDPDYADEGKYSIKQQKDAILTGKTLGRRLVGTWELLDNATGSVLDRKRTTLARVPFLTDRGTFIHNGSEYTLSNQMRLRPGIFTRVKDNGEIEAHANILPGKGTSHRYFLDPAKGVFYVRFGQAKIPLMPLVKALGAKDGQLQHAWGRELWHANAQKDDPSALNKILQKLVRKADLAAPIENKYEAIRKAIEEMEVDPEVSKKTLGLPLKNLNLDGILATTKKLLAVSRGEADVDDRDHLSFQNIYGPEDLLAERLAKDYGGLRRALFYKSSFKNNLSSIQPSVLTKQIEAAILHSGLGQNLEEINPADVFDKQSRISRLGEGGIPSVDAVPDEARAVQPSHFGFMDPVRTPESFRAGVDVFISNAARKGKDNRIYSPFLDRKGKLVWKSPQDIDNLVVAFPGEMDRTTNMVGVMHNGRLTFRPRRTVDLVMPNFENAFSPLGNIVPMKSAVKAQRMAMASRMLTQALPLLEPEAPLVRAGVADADDSYEHRYGKYMGAVTSSQPGTVLSVSKDSIRVKYDDGTVEDKELYSNFPYNRKSVTAETTIYVKKLAGYYEGPIADYNFEPGDKTLSIDPVTKLSAWQTITGFIEHINDKALLKVTTASGRSVVVTEDHSLITLDSAGNLMPVYPEDCVINRTRLPIARFNWQESAEQVNPDKAVLAGLYLAEGHYAKQKNQVCIAVTGASRIEQVMSLCKRLGLSSYVNGGNVCFSDRDTKQWLLQNFGKGSGYKFISPAVYSWSKEALIALVTGYMAGDGCLWSDGQGAIQVAAVSTSKALRDGLVNILSILGCFTTLFDAPRQHKNINWNDGYGFRVITSHLVKLPTWFFYADRQAKYLELLPEKTRESSFDLIPLCDKAARQSLYAALPEVSAYVFKTASMGAVSRLRMGIASGVWGQWAASDVMWDKVVDVTVVGKNVTYVYDLCVEGSEAFAVNNGLVVHNTYVNNTPVVQPGDRFEANQTLAKSNYTDDKGVTALGKNLYAGYLPYKGLNFEDASVISESAAKKLSSQHMYQHGIDWTSEYKKGKADYVSLFGSKYSRKLLNNIDDDGLVKEGTVVNYGDPLILAARQKEHSYGKVHKKRELAFVDSTETWKHHSPGVVTDVVKTPKGATVLVSAVSPMQVGDKLSGRYGDKGVVAAIVPDEQMPRGPDGKPFEVLLNPLGIISRTNPSQMIEAALGKIAMKTGKPYNVPDFKNIDDLTEYAEQELKKHGLTDLEDVTDPETGRKIPQVFTGHRFFMKLHHTSESKSQGRGTGGYTMDATPAKGGETGCFIGRQKIKTILGPLSIAKICERRLGVPVLTFSEKLQEWVYRPITDWFVHEAAVADVLSVYVNGPCESFNKERILKASYQCLHPTKNHEVLMYDGSRKLAGELKEGDQLVTWGTYPTELQNAFLLGTLLGDTYCNENAVAFEHSIKQAAYVNWKASVLSGLDPYVFDTEKQPTEFSTGLKVGRRLARMAYISGGHICRPLQKLCYSGPGGIKTVTEAWLKQLTGLSLAVWFVDDGTVTSKGRLKASKKKREGLSDEKFTGAICTQGFDRASVLLLVDWLAQRYGITCGIGGDNRINISSRACRVIIREVANWVPWHVIPKSKGTLRRCVKRLQEARLPASTVSINKLVKVPLHVVKIGSYKPDKPVKRIKVYDFTVNDTHTYAAGTALVSNSKRISLLDNNALLSHGATEVVRDVGAIRGQRNEEFWLPFMQGLPTPKPKVPFIYEKFVNELRGAGINVVRDGTNMNVMAMTDKDIDQLAEDRFIQSGDTVQFEKGMKPIKGGLFDPTLTGGNNGNRWSAIKLHESMPNPVMEEPIRRLLGLTQKDFESVIAGKKDLRGSTGPKAISQALASINIDREIQIAREAIKTGRAAHRDAAVRRLGYLKSAKRLGLHPKDWMLSKVPVLPPIFRPVAVMSDNKMPLVTDVNYLYKELIEANNNWSDMSKEVDDVGEERLAVYDSFKALSGLGEPVHPKLQEKQVKGILKHIFGASPKFGAIQRRLISSTVDLVGRAVITPNPDLDMDQVGLPEGRAWDIYKNFVVRRLKRRGMPLVDAVKQVVDKTKLAREELVQEMSNRPVIINRAPVLHRFGIMAFYPKLVKGDTLQISPLIVKGFNADFDGDAMQYHVPVSDEARQEAIDRMLPSRNLLSPADFKTPVHSPSQEYVGGLYAATGPSSGRRPKTYRNLKDVLAAYRRGEIEINDNVEVMS